jgi:large subunit ribosomal protein L37Ae
VIILANPSIRYGASIRKMRDVVKAQKSKLYKCEGCGKVAVERISTGIWRCRHCGATYAGGAYALTTTAGETAKRLIEGAKARE